MCATLCISWLSVEYNNKKTTFWVFIQLRWARCDLYYIFTVTDRFWPKKKKNHGNGREWESFFREWNGTGFSPSFFCGSGTGEVWKSTPVSPSNGGAWNLTEILHRDLFFCKKEHSWADTTFSKILDINRRFEIKYMQIVNNKLCHVFSEYRNLNSFIYVWLTKTHHIKFILNILYCVIQMNGNL